MPNVIAATTNCCAAIHYLIISDLAAKSMIFERIAAFKEFLFTYNSLP